MQKYSTLTVQNTKPKIAKEQQTERSEIEKLKFAEVSILS